MLVVFGSFHLGGLLLDGGVGLEVLVVELHFVVVGAEEVLAAALVCDVWLVEDLVLDAIEHVTYYAVTVLN